MSEAGELEYVGRHRTDTALKGRTATRMLTELRVAIRNWETSDPGSRAEFEAAENATRLASELDAALCDGQEVPEPWRKTA